MQGHGSPMLHPARIPGDVQGQTTCIKADLLGLHLICHMAPVIDTALEETGAGKVSGPAGNEGKVDALAVNIDFALIQETVDDGRNPATCLVQGWKSWPDQLIVPDKHVIVIDGVGGGGGGGTDFPCLQMVLLKGAGNVVGVAKVKVL